MSSDIDVSFDGYAYDEEVTSSEKPKPGTYFCLITQARIGMSKKNNPQIHVVAEIQKAEQQNTSEIGKEVNDYIPLPYAGIAEGSIKKCHAFCSRLSLLPKDAWGPAAKNYKASMIETNAKGKPCFVKLKAEVWTDKNKVERPSSSPEFAAWYPVNHPDMAEYQWMVTGDAPPSNGTQGQQRPPADDI